MGSQTRWIGVVAVVAILAVGVIVWTVVQKKNSIVVPPDALLDSLVMGVVEKTMLPEARRAVSGHCIQFLEHPVVVDMRLQCETSERGVKLSRAEVVSAEDGGAVAPDFSTCVTEAVTGLENATTQVLDPRSDAGVKLRLPPGRSYELDVVLDFGAGDSRGYLP